MTADHPTPAQEAAAFHGLATNAAFPSAERLQCAIQALDLYEAELARRDAALADLTRQRDEAVAELDDWRAAPPDVLQSRIEAELRDEVRALKGVNELITQKSNGLQDTLERQAPVIEAARAYRDINRTVWTELRAAAIDDAYTALAAAVDALGPVDPGEPVSDLAERLKGVIEEKLAEAPKLLRYAQDTILTLADPKWLGRSVPGWHEWPAIEAILMLAIRQHEAALRVLERHRPIRRAADSKHEICDHTWADSDGWIAMWPCQDVMDLADAYGVPVADALTQKEPTP